MGFKIYVIFCTIASVASLLVLFNFPYAELHEIENDVMLKKYEYEIRNPRNDGWSVIAYKQLYRERLTFLLKENNVHSFWWRFYMLTKNFNKHV